jgi:hypothetical protein
MVKKLENNRELKEYAQANEFSDFIRMYETRLENQMLSSLPDNLYVVEKIFSDTDLKKIMVTAAEFYYKWAKTSDLSPITPETPSQNRLQFRESIQSCTGYISDRSFPVPRDRFIIGRNIKYNVTSLTTIIKVRFSETKQ